MRFARPAKKEKKGAFIFRADQKTTGRPIASRRFYFRIFLFTLLTAELIYGLFWSPMFKIKKISIADNDFAQTEEIEKLTRNLLTEKIWRVIPGDSFFTISEKTIKERIGQNFREADKISARKHFPAELTISLSPRQTAIVWCQSEEKLPTADLNATNDEKTATSSPKIANADFFISPEATRCFFADDNGLAFREAPLIFGTAAATIYDQSKKNINLGSVFQNPRVIKNIKIIQTKMQEINASPQGFLINDRSLNLAVLTNKNWRVYFDLSRPVEAPLKILETLLNGELKNNQIELKYIDLRTLNRVYYK